MFEDVFFAKLWFALRDIICEKRGENIGTDKNNEMHNFIKKLKILDNSDIICLKKSLKCSIMANGKSWKSILFHEI